MQTDYKNIEYSVKGNTFASFLLSGLPSTSPLSNGFMDLCPTDVSFLIHMFKSDIYFNLTTWKIIVAYSACLRSFVGNSMIQ